MVLDLRTSNILISVHYLPISSVATKDVHFKENTEVHRKYPSSAKNRYGGCSYPGPAVHASGASKWLISPFVPASGIFVDRTEKYDRQRRQKYKRKNKQTRQRQNISLQKSNCITKTSPS